MERSIVETLTTLVREALLDDNPLLPALPGDPAEAAPALADFEQASQDLLALPDAAGLDAWKDRLQEWVEAARSLGEAAFAREADAINQLIVRVLQSRLPRVAAFLVMIGVIREQETLDGPRLLIDRERLEMFLRDPGTIVNEALWDALLADLGAPDALNGHLIAVLFALLILAPQTILALARGTLKVSGPGPPGALTPGTPFATFRQATRQWVSFTVPLPDPTRPDDEQSPASLFDLASGLQPNFSVTVAFRGHRRRVAGERVTDFEAWLGLGLTDPNDAGADGWSYDFGDHWILRVRPSVIAGFGYDGGAETWHGAFRPTFLQGAPPVGAVPGDAGRSQPLEITFSREPPEGEPDVLLGPPYDTRLVIGDLLLYLRLREDQPVFEIGARVERFEIVLPARFWREFGVTFDLWRDGLRFGTDVEIGYVHGEGLLFNLASELETRLTLEKSFFDGAFTLHSVHLKVYITREEEWTLGIEARLHVSFTLGPVVGVIDGVGLRLDFLRNEPFAEIGKIKSWDLDFLPPTGIGLALELEVVSGGGFLDFTGGPRKRYGGALYLKVTRFAVNAFGLYEETPSGRKSIIAVLGIRFFPGIFLGYGFFLSGIGGLVGINRRADTDALRERLVSGAAGNVLFNDDPIRNAPVILRDLEALFPAQDGVHVAGPTLRITFIQLVHFDLGIIIELPGPSKIVFLGSARAELVVGDLAFIRVRNDVAGVIDFQKKVVEFDATLINSKLLIYFDLTGDAAFRLSYGSQPYAMLTVGGFHPNFEPAPAVFPDLTRVAMTWNYGGDDDIWLRFECYFAVTTNTIQLGGRIEAGLREGNFHAIGWIAADILFQFSPFFFCITFSAGFRVRWKSTTIAGVRVEGILSGPGPIRITGRACIEILFFDICVEASFTIGEAVEQVVAVIASLIQEVAPELARASNVAALEAEDRQASVVPAAVATEHALISPLGGLSWTQNRTPLNIAVSKVGSTKLDRPGRLTVSAAGAGGPVRDWFAPNDFTELSDSESLNQPSFQQLDAGISLGLSAPRTSSAIDADLEPVVIRLPQIPLTLAIFVLPLAYAEMALDSRSPLAIREVAPTIKVRDESWTVMNRAGGVQGSGLTPIDAHQRARAGGHLAAVDGDMVELGGI